VTDKRILGRGRFTFDADALPTGRPLDGFNRYSGTMSFSLSLKLRPFQMAGIARGWFGRDGIKELCGYDPQKLLPAPGSDPSWFRRDFLEFFAAQLGQPSMMENIFKPGDFHPNEVIDFDTISPTARHIDFRKLYPDVQSSFKAAEHRFKRAVIAITSLDFSHVERRVLAAMSMPGVVALQLDMREPAGSIYRLDESHRLFPLDIPRKLTKAEAVKQNGRSAGYLDHDPTKKHKRGKRK
jgi:hypothetical protein